MNNTLYSCMQSDSNSSTGVDISRDELEEFVADYGFKIGTQLTDTERVAIMRFFFINTVSFLLDQLLDQLLTQKCTFTTKKGYNLKLMLNN